MTPSVSTARMESVTQIELPEDVIDVCDVFKSFMHPSGESIEVLSGVNLSVRRQEFLSIIGPYIVQNSSTCICSRRIQKVAEKKCRCLQQCRKTNAS